MSALSDLQKKGNIHMIEPLGAFDGPGLRYVLFLQGCPFQCQFCHNRDSWSTEERTIMTVEEVLKDYAKYKFFYKQGGITVSGGEPMFQLEFLTALFKEARKQGIHTTIDTSAANYTIKNKAKFLELLGATNLVLLDLKQINNAKHKILVGSPNTHVLEFAKLLSEIDKDTVIRHVTIPGINNDEKDILELRKFMDLLTNIVGIDILPYHTSGIRKWEELGLEYPLKGVVEPTSEEVERVTNILKKDFKYKEIKVL